MCKILNKEEKSTSNFYFILHQSASSVALYVYIIKKVTIKLLQLTFHFIKLPDSFQFFHAKVKRCKYK